MALADISGGGFAGVAFSAGIPGGLTAGAAVAFTAGRYADSGADNMPTGAPLFAGGGPGGGGGTLTFGGGGGIPCGYAFGGGGGTAAGNMKSGAWCGAPLAIGSGFGASMREKA